MYGGREVRVLAIDPGSSLGYAMFTGTEVHKGRCAPDRTLSDDRRLEELNAFIDVLIDDFTPQVVLVENVAVGNYPAAAAKLFCIGTLAFVMATASKYSRDLAVLSVQSIKSHFGIKRGINPDTGKKWNQKAQMIAKMNERYGLSLRAKDDDIADALALGSYYLDTKA